MPVVYDVEIVSEAQLYKCKMHVHSNLKMLSPNNL